MIRSNQIPDEVVDALWKNGFDLGGAGSTEKLARMRAAIAAALAAWPDAILYDWCGVDCIILPVEKENNNE